MMQRGAMLFLVDRDAEAGMQVMGTVHVQATLGTAVMGGATAVARSANFVSNCGPNKV